ncbi:MAG: anthranilate phosphoribosyltransferase, partial [Planctomycetota bacterium]
MPDPDLLHAALVDLTRRTSLDEERAHAVFQCVLAGDAAPEQIAALLALLEAKGIAVDELVGAARVMREHVTRVEAPADGRPVIDTCGTGGAPKAFNISTAAAIVAASTGLVRVAKHGNRSRTGRGSAEVLQALGVNVDADPAAQARCLEAAG